MNAQTHVILSKPHHSLLSFHFLWTKSLLSFPFQHRLFTRVGISELAVRLTLWHLVHVSKSTGLFPCRRPKKSGQHLISFFGFLAQIHELLSVRSELWSFREIKNQRRFESTRDPANLGIFNYCTGLIRNRTKPRLGYRIFMGLHI